MSVTFNFGDLLSARSICGDTLYDLAAKYPNVWVLTADCGGNLVEFKRDFPDRFVDTGIAEQNAAGIAAGLAISGGMPFIMGMTPFLVMRALEQNRTDICYQNLPVRLIGYGSGLTSGGGATHNAVEDVALMRSLVNMTVVSAGDPNMVRDMLIASVDHDGPVYFRLTQGKSDRVIYEVGTVAFRFGKGIVAREGKDVSLIVHGGMLPRAIDISDRLKAEGIGVRVIDMCSIKPIDENLVLSATEETRNIIVWEDHLAYGGLASAIADVFADRCIMPKNYKRMGVPQVYAGFGKDEELYRKYGYDAQSVIQAIRGMIE